MALPVFSAFQPSTLTERSQETIDHIVFSVAASDAMRAAFRHAGQFVKMRVHDEAGVPHEGIFALATAPFEDRFLFLARTNNPAGGEAADRIARMPIGAPLEITLPAGDGFPLERAHDRDLAFLAVGTAIAPVRSALEVVLRDRDRYGALSLDYGLRSLSHLPFGKDIERWRTAGVIVTLHVGELRADGTYIGGRAQDAVFARLAGSERTAILAVGHDALVRDVRARFPDMLHNY